MLKVGRVGLENVVPKGKISSEVTIVPRVMPIVVVRIDLKWNESPYAPREVISAVNLMRHKNSDQIIHQECHNVKSVPENKQNWDIGRNPGHHEIFWWRIIQSYYAGGHVE